MQRNTDYRILAVIAGTGLLLCFLFLRYKWQERPSNDWIKTIESDGMGYYMYLPSIFIYGDLQYEYTQTDAEQPHYFEEVRTKLIPTPDGRRFTRYYSGTAIMQLPFFALGHVAALLGAGKADGYSLPYQMAIAIAAAFYFLLGIWLSYHVALYFGVGRNHAALAAMFVATGTNLLNYTWKEPAFSHVYLFALVAGFYYAFIRFMMTRDRVGLWMLFLLWGLIIITRPTTGLCALALPVFIMRLPSKNEIRVFLQSNLFALFTGCLTLCLLICIQLLLYYLQTGSVHLVSYEGDHLFDFSHPAVLNFLIGFRKGWFIYTPMAALALLGLRHVWFKKWWRMTGLFLFYTAAVWVLSSWWNWWYGGSFGMRAMTDFYVLTIVLLALLFQSLNKYALLTTTTIAIVLVLLNIAQNMQYYRNILYYDEMTEARYSEIFLNPSPWLHWSTAPLHSECDYGKFNTVKTQCADYHLNCDKGYVQYEIGHPLNSYGPHEELNARNPYSSQIVFEADSAGLIEAAVEFEILASVPAADMDAGVVVSVEHKGNQLFWNSLRLNRLYDTYGPPITGKYCLRLPSPLPPGAFVKCYVLNMDERAVNLYKACYRLKK